jgi:metal-dependent amidase/aminoacylase/carboxypeptidase family protein
MRSDHRKPLQAGTQENIIPDDATRKLNVRTHAEPAA